MKYKILLLIRLLGLLKLADITKYNFKRIVIFFNNRRFVRKYPEFAVPPKDLAFDAYNNFNWHDYRKQGKNFAEVLVKIIQENHKAMTIKILEWGCGPGRIIRYLPELLSYKDLSITGSDYNKRTIRWCQKSLPGIRFVDNRLMPPMAFDDGQFDVIYNYSVFTHLSEESQIAWSNELHRVLKPGGLIICSTHGEHYKYLLNREEYSRFKNGRSVSQGKYPEGKKWFLSFHPPSYVRNVLLKDFYDLRLIKPDKILQLFQDIWVANKGDKILVE